MKGVKMKAIIRFFWAKEWRPTKAVPMAIKEGISR
jgi:hypothetical protein